MPRRGVTKKSRGRGALRKPSAACYKLVCHYGHQDIISEHPTAHAAACQAWKWAQKEQFCVLSNWQVRHHTYGWHDAYNVVVTEEGTGWDEEWTWVRYVTDALTAGRSFEAHGEGSHSTAARIVCEFTAHEVRPFWHEPKNEIHGWK